ncbi:PIG-L deacetylase family protein [Paenibacillus sp. L3-i20]|uniref:PIG-L deacetylase family protein n=1 Tax=Paenibacillus sp. L3-i20 TaxID=2905833 RepID=UPI001EE0C9D8|nr:PIG-L family deacetylase [Paenibacillus sp. L3-i20]GKU77623.1 GlcNAc-PI de-N-acetylase [Paenibacillus sp. L3-i20]
MSERKPITILGIGAHVGDVELVAGGVLASHFLKGDKIATLALTAGERGVPDFQDVNEYREQKIREAHTFAGMLGGEARVFDIPDGEIEDDQAIRLRVCDVIREVKPDIIITHHCNSMHKDHATTHRIVNDARFFAGLRAMERELPSHFAPKLYYGENWEDAVDYVPYVYVDFNQEAFDLWIEALSTHWFVTGSKSFNYMDYYKSLARVRGLEARKEYAETFMIPAETMRLRQSEL